MLQGRMSCLWAPRHSESPMLVINIHQAGSATNHQPKPAIALGGGGANQTRIRHLS
jgi:hypothetical protein